LVDTAPLPDRRDLTVVDVTGLGDQDAAVAAVVT
jgi:hypothetical protein